MPRGTWLSGSVQLPSRTTLRIEAGTTILGSRDPARYPVADPPWEGHSVQAPTPLLWAADAEDVAIVGEGTIDGQGEDWRTAVRFIHRFALLAPGGAGLTFEADGDRHARAWIADDHAVAQCCHFTGRSAEKFIAGVDLAEMTIERGAAIESEAVCRLACT